MGWDIQYYDEKLQAAVLALPPGILARYIHLTDRMVEYGPDLGDASYQGYGCRAVRATLEGR